MGLPILQATYGDEALLYGALFQFPFNFLIYTYGIAVLRGESSKSGGPKLSKFLNVGVVSCIIAIIIYLTKIPMPGFINTSSRSLSGLAAPLSMMVIGQSMVHIKVKDLFGDLRLLVFSLIKLIIVPVVGVLLLKLFIRDEMFLNVCFIMMATPIASMTAMLSQQYGGDYKTASKGVALSTVLSVITIPLISFILF
jgi:predicted permease